MKFVWPWEPDYEELDPAAEIECEGNRIYKMDHYEKDNVKHLLYTLHSFFERRKLERHLPLPWHRYYRDYIYETHKDRPRNTFHMLGLKRPDIHERALGIHKEAFIAQNKELEPKEVLYYFDFNPNAGFKSQIRDIAHLEQYVYAWEPLSNLEWLISLDLFFEHKGFFTIQEDDTSIWVGYFLKDQAYLEDVVYGTLRNHEYRINTKLDFIWFEFFLLQHRSKRFQEPISIYQLHVIYQRYENFIEARHSIYVEAPLFDALNSKYKTVFDIIECDDLDVDNFVEPLSKDLSKDYPDRIKERLLTITDFQSYPGSIA